MNQIKVIFALVLLCAALLPGECITGGKEAVANSHPYMASLQWNGKHECGGFLISNQWVMSAAHCFQNGRDSGVKVVLGAHSLSNDEDTKKSFDVSAVYNHPDFTISNYDNDIALLKLESPITENYALKPLKFQRDGGVNPEEGAAVEAAGWGSLDNRRGKRPDKLQELSITVMERWLCGRSDYYGADFTNNMLCAADYRKDTCDGDSGGPLLYKGVAVGITSNGGRKCGFIFRPGLYTIISHYTQWIDRTTTQ